MAGLATAYYVAIAWEVNEQDVAYTTLSVKQRSRVSQSSPL